MHDATTPPGRVTRAISRAPAAASRMNATTSEESATSNAVVLERERLGGAHAHVGARVARPARVRELLGGVDRRHVVGAEPRRQLARQPARAAADVERAHPGRHAGGVGQRDRELGDVAAHEAVVVIGGRGELHAPSQLPHGPAVKVYGRRVRTTATLATAVVVCSARGAGRGAREGAQLPYARRLQPADLVGAQHVLQAPRAATCAATVGAISLRFPPPAASPASGCRATRSRASGAA